MARNSFIISTLFLVCILGVITWFTLRPPERLAIDRVPAASAQNSSGFRALNKIANLAETLDLNCVTHNQVRKLKTQAHQLRLTGNLCPPLESLLKGNNKYKAPHIINQTNGFLATVFVTQGDLFTSDYIYLVQGRNQVLFTWESKKDKKSYSELLIVRQ